MFYLVSCVFMILTAGGQMELTPKPATVLQMHSVDETSAGITLINLGVQLEINKQQAPSTKGISLVIVLANLGNANANLINLRDGVQIQLLDSRGMPVRTNRQIPSSLIHVQRSTATENNNTVLKPGETFRLPVNLTETLSVSEDVKKQKIQTFVPIPPGAYKLSARITVISADHDRDALPEARTYIAPQTEIFLER